MSKDIPKLKGRLSALMTFGRKLGENAGTQYHKGRRGLVQSILVIKGEKAGEVKTKVKKWLQKLKLIKMKILI